IADRVVASDIFLVDRHPDHRQVAQRVGIAPPAPSQPLQQRSGVAHLFRQRQLLFGMTDPGAQPGEIQQLHEPNTSENGRKSTSVPGAISFMLSSRITKPSDCTIEDRMPAPSRLNLRAM